MDVKPESEAPKFVAHPEDIALDKEPTLFQQIYGNKGEESDSSDDEGGESHGHSHESSHGHSHGGKPCHGHGGGGGPVEMVVEDDVPPLVPVSEEKLD